MASAIETLKTEASNFNEMTKKAIPGCSFAAMNVDESGIVNMWGDFNSVKSAKSAISIWGIISSKLNGKISSKMEGKKIRVIVDFN